MTKRNGTEARLVRLSELILKDHTQDVYGYGVFDKDGEQICLVDDLYAEVQEREVRFLDVVAGGVLGIGGM